MHLLCNVSTVPTPSSYITFISTTLLLYVSTHPYFTTTPRKLPFSAGDISAVRICAGDVEKFLAGSVLCEEDMGGWSPSLFLPFLRGGNLFSPTSHTLTMLYPFFEGPFLGVCAKGTCECVCVLGRRPAWVCVFQRSDGSFLRLERGLAPTYGLYLPLLMCTVTQISVL
jgi:hypothetical protein